MRERAATLLRLAKTGLARRPRLEINQNLSFDDSMARDGLTKAVPAFHADLPIELWWLQQLLGCLPPADWTEQWQIEPETLLDAARRSKIPIDFETSWGWAAYRAGDTAFAALLLRTALDRLGTTLVEFLADSLPPADLEAIAIDWLDSRGAGFRGSHPAAPLLKTHQRPWSRRLTTAFSTSLKRYMHSSPTRFDSEIRSLLLDFARFFPVDMRAEIIAALTGENKLPTVWEDLIDELRLLLDFRAEMLQAIRTASDPTSET
jgi:hypothetical protein